jgi:hypothetical protein
VGLNLRFLHTLFLCFEVVSGLNISLAKLELVPMGNVENVDGFTSILGCSVFSLPSKYFGLLLGGLLKGQVYLGWRLLKR